MSHFISNSVHPRSNIPSTHVKFLMRWVIAKPCLKSTSSLPYRSVINHTCKSHDHDHQWAYLVMTWLPSDKRKCEHKVVRLMWVCLHFGRYISIRSHGIDCKQTWCKKSYYMNIATWLNPLSMSITMHDHLHLGKYSAKLGSIMPRLCHLVQLVKNI